MIGVINSLGVHNCLISQLMPICSHILVHIYNWTCMQYIDTYQMVGADSCLIWNRSEIDSRGWPSILIFRWNSAWPCAIIFEIPMIHQIFRWNSALGIVRHYIRKRHIECVDVHIWRWGVFKTLRICFATSLCKSPNINQKSTSGISCCHNLEPWGPSWDDPGPILGRRAQQAQKICWGEFNMDPICYLNSP